MPDKISNLQNEGDRYTRKIEQEKRRIQELEHQIGTLTAKIEVSRRNRGDSRGNKNSSAVSPLIITYHYETDSPLSNSKSKRT
jgi:hypothetical protein